MPERVRIYIHDTARKAKKIEAIQYVDSLGREATIYHLKFPVEPIPDYVTTVGVVGRRCISTCASRRCVCAQK